MTKHKVNKFGNGLHIILSKDEYNEGEIVFVSKNLDLDNNLTPKQEQQVRSIIKDELFRAKQGF